MSWWLPSLFLVDVEDVTPLLGETIGVFVATLAFLGPAAAPGQSPSASSMAALIPKAPAASL